MRINEIKKGLQKGPHFKEDDCTLSLLMNIQLIENAYRHFLIEKKGTLSLLAVLRIRNFCLDPELLFRIRIQQNKKEEINKNGISHCRPMNSGLFVL